mmetsp:Transcript_67214/g.107756  ORF Transcript_67214/g.107756 Transcript_67214/m.107756 type:complete len:119 (-) Transcript_67214:248-604(-)
MRIQKTRHWTPVVPWATDRPLWNTSTPLSAPWQPQKLQWEYNALLCLAIPSLRVGLAAHIPSHSPFPHVFDLDLSASNIHEPCSGGGCLSPFLCGEAGTCPGGLIPEVKCPGLRYDVV